MFASRLAVAQQAKPVSTWTPLRIGVFRAMRIAVLVSNIGTWMQAVGAQWLVVHLPHAAILVSLVQAADYVPDVLFGIVGGVLADIFDRRLLLIVVQLALAVVGLALTVLTYLAPAPGGVGRSRSRARPAALVLHQLQRHAERRLRRREDEADLVGLDLALQDDASACQFGFGFFEVVDFNSEMADDRGLAALELWHAETGSADLDQL